MNCLIQFWIIHLFVNWAYGEPIYGDNVKDAKENEFPFVVAISDVGNVINAITRSNLHQFCTGTLITKKHVLTAEHCLLTKQVDEVEVLVGSINFDRLEAYEPEEWTFYVEWKHKDTEAFPAHYDDIAVITLKKCVEDANVQPAKVSRFKPQDIFGANVKIAGWGRINHDVKPNVLKTIDLKVHSDIECEMKLFEIIKKPTGLFDRHLCAKSEPWAFVGCGDSGGPLLNERNKIIGVTLGICPKDEIILGKYSRQNIFVNQLWEKRVNLFASLHYYKNFIFHFTKHKRQCQIM